MEYHYIAAFAVVCFIIFASGILIQLYFFSVWKQVEDYESPVRKQEDLPPVSVIVAARNEFENLRHLLPKLLAQEYPTFEVIVVNDRSSDRTDELLQKLEGMYNQLRVVKVEKTPKGVGPKKYALTQGIKQAKHDHLLFTDADCIPVTEQWIERMASCYKEGINTVIGFSPYLKGRGFLNLFVRYETLLNGLQYLSQAINGKPYMAVGRNLSYHKTLFKKVDGFEGHMDVMSGDDDLFVNHNFESIHSEVAIEPDSQTISKAPKGYEAWFNQRIRHIGAGFRYRLGTKTYLGLFYYSQLASYMFIFLYYYDFTLMFIGFLLYLIRLFYLDARMRNACERLGLSLRLNLLPLLDVAYTISLIVLAIGSQVSKPKKWK